jgi:prepilin-type N-terminal cleavage/methylation domain-containing protein
MTRKPFAIATMPRTRKAFSLKQRGRSSGFTLAELLVSVFVLAIIILMVSQLMNNAAAITKTGHKHITTDTLARTVFDRMAADFGQMLSRTDVDYYVKGGNATYANRHGNGNGHGWGHHQTGQQGNDQIAFFSQVPGYSPGTGSQGPISLVAYRIYEGTSTDPAYLKLQRLGKGLFWNGVDNPNRQPTQNQYTSPIVFLPLLIQDRWPAATDGSTADLDGQYETIGLGVFRFEYYYLLKTGQLTDVPWNTDDRANWPVHTSMSGIGLGDVESVTVAIAVIDSASRAIIDAASPNSLDDLASDMADFRTSPGRGVGGQHNIGDLEASWQTSLLTDIGNGQTSNNTPLPPEAAKGIRIYSKTFDLRTFP